MVRAAPVHMRYENTEIGLQRPGIAAIPQCRVGDWKVAGTGRFGNLPYGDGERREESQYFILVTGLGGTIRCGQRRRPERRAGCSLRPGRDKKTGRTFIRPVCCTAREALSKTGA